MYGSVCGNSLKKMVGRDGIEPPTPGLTHELHGIVRSATCWLGSARGLSAEEF